MTQFQWLDDYQIGDHTIDQQHQYLFELANRIVDPDNSAQVRQNFMLLFKYVREHFAEEEGIMRRNNYPRLASHLAEHEKLLNRLLDISMNIGEGRFDLKQVAEFMTDWLLSHITEEDMLIGEFFRELNLLRSPAQPHVLKHI